MCVVRFHWRAAAASKTTTTTTTATTTTTTTTALSSARKPYGLKFKAALVCACVRLRVCVCRSAASECCCGCVRGWRGFLLAITCLLACSLRACVASACAARCWLLGAQRQQTWSQQWLARAKSRSSDAGVCHIQSPPQVQQAQQARPPASSCLRVRFAALLRMKPGAILARPAQSAATERCARVARAQRIVPQWASSASCKLQTLGCTRTELRSERSARKTKSGARRRLKWCSLHHTLQNH